MDSQWEPLTFSQKESHTVCNCGKSPLRYRWNHCGCRLEATLDHIRTRLRLTFWDYSWDFMVGEGHAVGSLNTFVLSLLCALSYATVLYCATICPTTVCSSVYACALLLCATATTMLYSILLYYPSVLQAPPCTLWLCYPSLSYTLSYPLLWLSYTDPNPQSSVLYIFFGCLSHANDLLGY